MVQGILFGQMACQNDAIMKRLQTVILVLLRLEPRLWMLVDYSTLCSRCSVAGTKNFYIEVPESRKNASNHKYFEALLAAPTSKKCFNRAAVWTYVPLVIIRIL